MSRSLEELFENYRSGGDLDALGEAFDRTAPALLRIASHLCSRRQDAEDVVQATFVRAIECAELWDGDRPLVPWLVGILGNRSRHLRRRDARQPDLERLGPPEESVDPLRVAEGREFGEAVEATIEELPSRYRSVLRLHLLDGRGPSEIASALERRPGTVRSQLARGLGALRRLLPPGFVAGAANAQGAVIVKIRASVLAHAGTKGGATAGAVSPVLVGGIAMQKTVFGAAAVVLVTLSLVVWSMWSAGNALPSSGPATGRGSEHSDEAASLEGATSMEMANHESQRVRVGASEVAADSRPAGSGAETGGLCVRATWRRDRAPASGVMVFVERDGAAESFARWQNVTGADGVARFAELPAGAVRIATGRSEYEFEDAVEIVPGEEVDHELALAGVTVRGVVVDAADRPVEGARIVVIAYRARELTRTDVDGRFTLAGVDPDIRIAARARGHAPSVRHRVPRAVNGELGELRIVLPGAGGSLVCTVIEPSGTPLPDAIVSVGAGHWRTGRGSEAPVIWQLTTDEHGRVEFHGIESGEHDVLAWAAGLSPWRGTARIVESSATELTIEFEPGASLSGIVRDSEGRALPGYEVAVGRAGSAAYERFGAFAFQSSRSDSAGVYRIEGLPAGEVAARATGGDVDAKAKLHAITGEELRWDPEIAVAGGVPGRIIGPDGRGLEAIVEGDTREVPSRWIAEFAGSDGRFYLKNIERGQRVRLSVRLRYFPLIKFDGPLPEEGELVLRVGAEDMPAVRIRGVCVDEANRPVPMADVGVMLRRHGGTPVFRTDDSGFFDVGPFPAREFSLWIRADGCADTRTESRRAAPGDVVDFGTIQLKRGGRVNVQLFSDAALPKSLYLPVVRIGGKRVGHVEIKNGSGALEGLEAGRYELQLRGRGLALSIHSFEIASGGTAELRIPVERGVPVSFSLENLPVPAPKSVSVELDAGDGRRLLTIRKASVLSDGRIYLQSFALRPGTYRVRVSTEARALGSQTFEVVSGVEACQVAIAVRE